MPPRTIPGGGRGPQGDKKKPWPVYRPRLLNGIGKGMLRTRSHHYTDYGRLNTIKIPALREEFSNLR